MGVSGKRVEVTITLLSLSMFCFITVLLLHCGEPLSEIRLRACGAAILALFTGFMLGVSAK